MLVKKIIDIIKVSFGAESVLIVYFINITLISLSIIYIYKLYSLQLSSKKEMKAQTHQHQILGKIYNNYKFLTLELCNLQSRQILTIQLENNSNGEIYGINIDQNYIDNNPYLKILQYSLLDLKTKLIQNNNDLSVNEKAQIIYKINLNGKIKDIIFELNKIQLDEIRLLKRRMEIMRENFQFRLSKLQNKVKANDKQSKIQTILHQELIGSQHCIQLKESLNKSIKYLKNIANDQKVPYNSQILNLSKQLQTVNNKIEQMNSMNKQNKQMKKGQVKVDKSQFIPAKVKQLQNKLACELQEIRYKQMQIIEDIRKIKDNEDTIMKYASNMQNNQQKIKKDSQNLLGKMQILEQKVNRLQLVQKFPQPLNHPDNPHQDLFLVEIGKSDKKGAKITYIQQSNGGTYNWIKKAQIPQRQISTFKIMQTSTHGRCIFTGIATKAIFGLKKAEQSKQSISYYSWDGNVFQNGKRRKGGRNINDQQLIKVAVDMIKWQVVWFAGEQRLAKASIPQVMRNKSLFLVIIMYDEQDTVELLYE